jgi:putative transposase
MGWDGKQYEIRACYAESETPQIAEGIIVGVDLGEIHLAVAHDGVQANSSCKKSVDVGRLRKQP